MTSSQLQTLSHGDYQAMGRVLVSRRPLLTLAVALLRFPSSLFCGMHSDSLPDTLHTEHVHLPLFVVAGVHVLLVVATIVIHQILRVHRILTGLCLRVEVGISTLSLIAEGDTFSGGGSEARVQEEVNRLPVNILRSVETEDTVADWNNARITVTQFTRPRLPDSLCSCTSPCQVVSVPAVVPSVVSAKGLLFSLFHLSFQSACNRARL